MFFMGGSLKAFGVIYVELLDFFDAGEFLSSLPSTINTLTGVFSGESGKWKQKHSQVANSSGHNLSEESASKTCESHVGLFSTDRSFGRMAAGQNRN